MTDQYGATKDEWLHFDILLGLTEDLLPVVSNPNAKISINSKIKQLGKTPSLYNKDNHAVGIADWTSKRPTDKDIAKWSANPDYGICIQTRRVRAIDVDVTDLDSAMSILEVITDAIGFSLPMRTRQNSPRFLLAFIVEGDLPKTIIQTEHGAIEFLANGQQFIAAGTHTSGSRYEWAGGLPDELPVLSMEQYQGLIELLQTKFGKAGSAPAISGVMKRNPKTRTNIEVINDAMLEHLEVLSYGKEGQAFILCPFASEHTSDTGETSTAYFPKGTRGYAQGHFKCLHAHCAGRSDQEFMDALDINAAELMRSGFDVVPEEDVTTYGKAKGELSIELPVLRRNKQGEILPEINNIESILNRPDVLGECVAFDRFKDEVVLAPNGPNGKEWRALRDTDYTRIRGNLARIGFLPITKELMRDTLHHVAEVNEIDTAQVWLRSLQWDGTPRIETFLPRYFNTTATEYTKEVSLYMWTALAGRVLRPGIKADMVPILVGKQGVGKSFGISELVPDPDFYTTVNLNERDDNLNRRMRGKLVLEIAELRGLHQRDSESIKDFITHTYDQWVPKYMEHAKTYPRRSLFIGTTNQQEFLADTTGNRRWLPVDVGASVDIVGLRMDREQLWAEGAARFELTGIEYAKAQLEGEKVHENYRLSDAFGDAISDWLETPDSITGEMPIEAEYLTVREVMKDALGIDLKLIKRGDEMRVGAYLRELGFTRKKINRTKMSIWGYFKNS